jgi:hypothetical protein
MCKNFSGNVPDLRAFTTPNPAEPTWDNIASSVVATGANVALYELPNYQGRCETTRAGAQDADLRNNYIGNDRISSLRVGATCPPGVALCMDVNYGGICEFFPARDLGAGEFGNNDAILGTGNVIPNDSASSLHIEFVPSPTAYHIGAFLCADHGFRNCGFTTVSQPDLRNMTAWTSSAISLPNTKPADGKSLNDRVTSFLYRVAIPPQ